jgi:transposase
MNPVKLPEQIRDYDFTTLYKQEHRARLKIRWLGLSYLQAGKTIQETAELLHVERHTVGEWLKRFREDGLAGLVDKSPPGPRPKLTQAQEQALINQVNTLLETHAGGRLTAKKAQQWIKEQWGIVYKLSGIYDLFKRLNLSWITARPRHAKADESEQKEYKKNSSHWLKNHCHP